MSIRSLVDSLDGVSSSKMFGGGSKIADHRSEILREKYSSRFDVVENNNETSPLSSFFKKVVNKTAWPEDPEIVKPSLIEGLGEKSSVKMPKNSLIEGLGSSMYDSVEVPIQRAPRVYREDPIVVGTNDEQSIKSIREDLSAGSIHESTIHDYVKMAYLYRRKLINNTNEEI